MTPPIRAAENGGDIMDSRTGNDPAPIFPALGKYYALTSDLAYLIVRVAAGAFVIVHGWTKIFAMSHAGLTGYFAKLGLEPAGFWAYYIPFNETVVALLVVIGLWTRPAALLLVIEFIVLVLVVHVPRGYSMTVNGVEFPLFWLMALIAVLLRGGGPYSVDRKIGKEI
jgi:putative oxidoreductase